MYLAGYSINPPEQFFFQMFFSIMQICEIILKLAQLYIIIYFPQKYHENKRLGKLKRLVRFAIIKLCNFFSGDCLLSVDHSYRLSILFMIMLAKKYFNILVINCYLNFVGWNSVQHFKIAVIWFGQLSKLYGGYLLGGGGGVFFALLNKEKEYVQFRH